MCTYSFSVSPHWEMVLPVCKYRAKRGHNYSLICTDQLLDCELHLSSANLSFLLSQSVNYDGLLLVQSVSYDGLLLSQSVSYDGLLVSQSVSYDGLLVSQSVS